MSLSKVLVAAAGIAATGVLARFALKRFGSTTARQAEDALGTDFDDVEEMIVLKETFIPPNLLVEEVTTVRV